MPGLARYLPAILGVVCGLFLSTPAAQSETISLQLKWRHQFQFAGFYIALEKGYYREVGLDVRLIEGGPGKSSVEHVLKGGGHYGVADTGALLEHAAGKPLKALAAIFQHSPLALLVRADSNITSLTGLKGKRIMMQPGSLNADILAALNRVGITEQDFIRQEISYDINDLVVGNTDAFSVYITDQPHQLKLRGIPYRIFHPKDHGIDFYGDILITSNHEVSAHPRRVNAFLEASLKGWHYALQNTDETIDLIHSKYNTQEFNREQLYFEATKSSQMILKDVVTLGHMSKHRWQHIAETYAHQGLLQDGFPVSQFIHRARPDLLVILADYKWQITIAGLLGILIALSLQAVVLRRLVRNRTEKLRQSESRFRTLVANLPGATYQRLADVERTTIFISDEISNISGYPAERFLDNPSHSYSSIIHPDDRAQVDDTITAGIDGKNGYLLEYRIVHADGTKRWVSERGQPTFDSSGNVISLEGNIFDISREKRADALKLSTSNILEMIASGKPSQQIFHTVIQFFEARYPDMRASILRLDQERLYYCAGPSLPKEYSAAIEGLKIGPMVGSCGTAAYLKQRVIVKDIAQDPRWKAFADLALSFKLHACWSEPIITTNGLVLGTFAMYYSRPKSPTPDELHDISIAAKLVGIAIERDRSVARLRKLSGAVEQAGEAITITNREEFIEYVNPAFTRITGFTASEVIGKTPGSLNEYGHDAPFHKEMQQTIRQGNTWRGKIVGRKKDGSSYPAMLTISPIRDQFGETTHYVNIHEDLTELQHMEEQFQQAQKMEAIGTLVGGIAHDFNNMLAGINGNIYLAKKEAMTLPRVIDKLDRINSLTHRASDMIRQLLTFASKGTVQKESLSLSPFLKETIKLHQVSIPENIKLEIEILDDLQISVDATQFQQALLNLLTNARDATKASADPHILIRVEKFIADRRFLEKYIGPPQREFAHLSVTDNGHGISPESIRHIFEPFYTTKQVGKGTGLGLSMVFGSIKSHNGVIEVDSSEHRGTTFHIYLPLATPGLADADNAADEPMATGHGETILLVDDEEQLNEANRSVLETLGYQVITAMDGQQAVEVYRKRYAEIDIIILDMVMPALGGKAAATAIREQAPEAKIIYMTGYDLQGELKEEMKDVDEIVLTKPFKMQDLNRAIQKKLGD